MEFISLKAATKGDDNIDARDNYISIKQLRVRSKVAALERATNGTMSKTTLKMVHKAARSNC